MFTSLKYVMATVAFLLSANVMADDISWTGQSDWTGIGEAEIELATDVYSVFCVKNNGSTNPTVNSGANDLRVYAKGTLRILTEKTMTAIVFNISAQGKKRLTDITASTGTVTIDKSAWTVTWTGSATDVTFTVGEKATYGTDGDTKAGQFDIDSPIKVTTSDDGVFVKAPSFSPAGGTYTEAQTVTLTADSGLKILYSFDNTTYNYYYSPISVTETTTIYAIAEDASGNKSSAVSATYTIVDLSGLEGSGTATDPYTASDANKLCLGGAIPADKVYVQGKISKIESIDVYTGAASGAGSYGNATYFISKDGTETDQFEIYRGYSLNGEKFTSSDEIKAGDFVIVYGKLKLFNTTPEMDAGSSIFKLNDEGGVVVEPDRYETINAACVAATDTHKEAYITLKDVVVTYLNGNSVYVLEQASGRGFLFYGTNGLPADLKVGDVLQGTVFGDFYAYHGLPEMTPAANGTELTVSGNTTVEPNAVELSDMLANPAAYASMLISLEGFMFNETGLTDKAVTISQYGDEATLFDQFQVLTGVTFDTDAEYTATFITSVRDGVLQLYPIDKNEFDQGGGEQPIENAYTTIPELITAATDEHVVVTYDFRNNPLLVTYVSGKNIYVTDAASQTSGFLLFGSVDGFAPKAGDIIGGTMEGELYLYHGLPELAFTKVDAQVTSEGNNVEVNIAELANILAEPMAFASRLVKLEDVLFAESALNGKSVGISQNGNEAVLWDQFGVAGGIEFSTEETYSLSVIVTVRDGAVQVYPINRDELLANEPQYDYEGEGTQDVPYTLADVQHLWVPKTPSNPVWVRGIIIGCVNGSIKEESFSTTGIFAGAGKDGADLEVKSNIIIAPVKSSSKVRKAVAGGYELTECVPVNLASNTEFRNKLNIVDNPDVVGKEVLLKGTVEDYFSIAGVKNLEDAIIDGVSLGVHGVELDKAPLSGDIYTLAGQRVSTMTRGGLYIIGGKKVLVK